MNVTDVPSQDLEGLSVVNVIEKILDEVGRPPVFNDTERQETYNETDGDDTKIEEGFGDTMQLETIETETPTFDMGPKPMDLSDIKKITQNFNIKSSDIKDAYDKLRTVEEAEQYRNNERGNYN